jgi:hypothetical protein
MNSPFVRAQAAALAASVANEAGMHDRIRVLYRRVLARDPSEAEVALGSTYLAAGAITDYTHALLSTNEVIFWP